MAAYQEIRLENGLQLSSYQLSHLHSLEIGVYLRGGPLYENRKNQGVSHLLEHLCFRNLNGIPQEQLYRRLDEIGATLRGETYLEAVVFRLQVIPRFFDSAFDLMCRLFAPGKWTDEEIAAEKAVVDRQIESEEQDFWSDANRQYWRIKAGSFSMMGTAESVAGMSPALIHQWKKKIFRPGNACFVMTGNFSDGMLRKAESVLADLPGETETVFEQPTPLGFGMRDESCDHLFGSEDELAQVQLSFDINDDQVFPMCADILSHLTGEGLSSPLFVELREKRALTDEIFSQIKEVGYFRRLTIEYAVANQRLLESLEGVFAILERMRRYISPTQIERARVFFTDNQLMELDQADRMNELLGWGFLSGNAEECDLETRMHMYGDMTKEDILDAAQAIFRPENLCCYIGRNSAKVNTQALKEMLKSCRDMLI